MLVRLAQVFIILIGAAAVFLFAIQWSPPGPAAIAIGAFTLVLIVFILIRPASVDAWESFWETVTSWMRWW